MFYLHCLGGEGERVDGGDAGIGSIGDTVFAVFPRWRDDWRRYIKKRKIVVWAKFAEMLIMVVAAAGFLMHSTGLVLSSILLMGLQSALFSPSKYGLIRDIGGERKEFPMVRGHGDVRFRGYPDRDVDGGLFVGECDDPGAVRDPVRGGVVRLVVESDDSGTESEPMKESHETLNPVKFVKDMFVRALAFKGLNLGGCGTGHVLVYRFDDPNGAYRILPFGFGNERFGDGYRDVISSRGIGAGCYLAGVLSRRDVELGLVPYGGITTGVTLLAIFLFDAHGVTFAILVFLAAFQRNV